MHTATSHHETSPFWDKIAPKYAKTPVKDQAAYAQKLDWVRALLHTEDRVLEIGCGTGSTALHLAPSAAEILASDISRGMIAIAEDKRRAAGVTNVTFVQAVASGNFYEAPFDVILGLSLLHLVEDIPEVLSWV